MSVEPEPGNDTKVDQAILGLTFVWLGLTIGLAVIAAMFAVTVVFLDEPILDSEIGYLFLLAVPVGLVAAYLIAPILADRDPATVVRASTNRPKIVWIPGVGAVGNTSPTYPDWQGTNPTDPYYWFPVYVAQFFLRAGLTEGPGVICAVGFMLTSNWFVLGGVLVLLAALITQRPTRGKFDTWLGDVRARRADVDPPV